MQSKVGSVMSPKVDEQREALRRLAAALSNAAPSPVVDAVSPVVDPSTGAFLLPSNPETILARVQHIGHVLTDVQQQLEKSTDDHFVQFFDHLKQRNDEELALWMPKDTSATQEMIKTKNAKAAVLIPPATKPTKTEIGIATDILHGWLFVQLEAVMTATRAVKGAVYLRSSDGSGYIRAAVRNPPDADLPMDMALASGSTIGTVVMTGIGVNVQRSRLASQLELPEAQRAPERLTAPPLRVTTAIVMPIHLPRGTNGPITAGCLVLADKRGGPFDTVDEHRAWGFCSTAQAVVYRYGVAPFVQNKASLDVAPSLRSLSQYPPAYECPWSDTANPSVHGDSHVGLAAVPLWDTRQLLMRGGTAAATLSAKEISTQTVGINDEDVIESVAPYVVNLEALWRKALDSITELRDEETKKESQLAAKQSRIVDLEVSLRNLSKTMSRLKADVNALKRAAPSILLKADGVTMDAAGAIMSIGATSGGGGGGGAVVPFEGNRSRGGEGGSMILGSRGGGAGTGGSLPSKQQSPLAIMPPLGSTGGAPVSPRSGTGGSPSRLPMIAYNVRSPSPPKAATSRGAGRLRF